MDSIDESLDKFWVIESTGKVSDSENICLEKLIRETSNNITHTGERYETPLPWKSNHMKLPDNYQICEKKLFALLRRLQNSPKLLKEYDDAIRELAAEGYY